MFSDLMFGPLLSWGLVAVVIFWAVGAYNRLVRLRGKVLRIFATLAAQFERYGQWMAAHAPEGISPKDAVAPPEVDLRLADMWAGLGGAAAQFEASLAVARAKPLDVAAIAALIAARLVLAMAWQRLSDEALALARAEEQPDVLRAQWEQITAQTQSTDKALALAVGAYNHAVRQFPAVLLAWAFGFRPAQRL